jgi:hypothetical protein
VSDRDVTLRLTKAEALVLFDWLARDASRALQFEDHAEQQVLWVVEAQLEKVLTGPLSPDYKRLLSEARDQVRGSATPRRR